jgi:uncharacterized protein
MSRPQGTATKTPSKNGMPVIDTYVLHDWTSQEEIVEYLPDAWREVLGLTGPKIPGTVEPRLDVFNPYRNPFGDMLSTSAAPGYPGAQGAVRPGEAAIERGVGAAIITCATGKYVPATNYLQLAAPLCAAINDWTVDRWLSEPRNGLWGSILVPAQLPEKAAEEIRRVAAVPRMVQVLMTGNGLSKPLGHPLYHPIYEAAADFDLPIAIHADVDAPPDTVSQVAAIGPPATYGEYKVLCAQSLMTHFLSFVAQGVFEKFPSLKVVLVGGGIGWVPATLWRSDILFLDWGRSVQWVRRKPSDYFAEHFYLTTYQLEDSPEMVAAVLEAVDSLEDALCFASGYPAADSQEVAVLADRLPPSICSKATSANPLRLYGSRISEEALVATQRRRPIRPRERPRRPYGPETDSGIV